MENCLRKEAGEQCPGARARQTCLPAEGGKKLVLTSHERIASSMGSPFTSAAGGAAVSLRNCLAVNSVVW